MIHPKKINSKKEVAYIGSSVRIYVQYSVAKDFMLPNNQLYPTPIYELAF